MQDLLSDLELAIAAAYKAGEIIKHYKEVGFQQLPDKEGFGDPVLTEVDLLVDRFLHDTLLDVTSDYGWISEEDATINSNNAERTWVVDPIDGSSCFVKGLDTFTVSIGLVEYGCPVLGVIYNPARGQMFYSLKGHGMFLNDQRMYTENQTLSDSLLLLPMDGRKNALNKGLLEDVSQAEEVGSIAYRMALIAAGQADLTFVDHDLSVWDVAAGMAMLEEQNFEIKEPNGQYLEISSADEHYRIAKNGFVVCNEDVFEDFQKKFNI